MIVYDKLTGNALESDNSIVTAGWDKNPDRYDKVDRDKNLETDEDETTPKRKAK